MSAITSEIASNPPMKTTLRKIRAADPCGMRLKNGQRVGYLKLNDPSSVTAIDVAERNANGAASNDELAAARAAGAEAAWAALAARAALAALAAARDARDAASAAQADELRRVCAEIAAGRDPYPAAGAVIA